MSRAFARCNALHAMVGGALEKLSLPASQDAILRSMERNGMPREDEQAAPAGPASTMRQRGDARPHVQGLSFSKALTGKLRERAREERTTVHAALLAALGIAGGCRRRGGISPYAFPQRSIPEANWASATIAEFLSALPRTRSTPRYTNSALLASGALRAARSRALPMARLKRELPRWCRLCARRSAIALTLPGPPSSPRRPSLVRAMLTNLGAVPLAGQFGALKLKALRSP